MTNQQSITTKYKVIITWLTGNRTFNELWRRCDMNSDGAYWEDIITFFTTKKPSKKMIEKYKKAVIKANKYSPSIEIRDLKVKFETIYE